VERTREKRIEVSCDAAARLQIATQWLESYSSDTEVVVIAHSVEAANDLCLRVANSRGASFGIRRFTLNGLAARLAQLTLAASGRASASTLSFVAVVARAIHSLQAEGKLKYFAPVATRPGFPAAVAKTLAELRMNEVTAEALESLSRGGKDLAQIARAVEDELERAKLADRAIVFRAAIEASFTDPETRRRGDTETRGRGGQSNENASLLDVPVLLLDLQVRDRLELELVREIAERSPDVLAVVPQGDEQTAAKLEEALCAETGEQGDAGMGRWGDGGTGRRRGRGRQGRRGEWQGDWSN
jgi:hypothetical protein